DRLGDELESTEFAGPAATLVVTIGGHHHYRQLGPTLLYLAQEFEPVHAGHIDIREQHDQLRLEFLRKLAESLFSRPGKMHHIGALACFAAETLPEKLGDIGFVVDDQDTDAHDAASAAVARYARGNRTVNSVNSPTRLSTSIVPPCCWVTMS